MALRINDGSGAMGVVEYIDSWLKRALRRFIWKLH